MYKGCVLDADADVNSRRALKTDVHARVHHLVLKAVESHIPGAWMCRRGHARALKKLLFDRASVAKRGRSRHKTATFPRMHTACYDGG